MDRTKRQSNACVRTEKVAEALQRAQKQGRPVRSDLKLLWCTQDGVVGMWEVESFEGDDEFVGPETWERRR